MKRNDCGDGRRCTFSLQKCTALEYQNKIGIPYYTPGILDHIPLYEKSLQVGITVISAQSGNKRVVLVINYKSLYITFPMKTPLILQL